MGKIIKWFRPAGCWNITEGGGIGKDDDDDGDAGNGDEDDDGVDAGDEDDDDVDGGDGGPPGAEKWWSLNTEKVHRVRQRNAHWSWWW